jgi:hypothetical protein
LRKGRLLILFDGMDEMPSVDFLKRADELKRFPLGYGRLNEIVIACRKREYSGSFAHSELIVEPFDTTRITQYLTAQWLLYQGRLTPEARYSRREVYLEIARPGHPLSAFVTNPFSLKLVTTYFFENNGSIPQDRAQMFKGYVEERLRRECARTGLSYERGDHLLRIWRRWRMVLSRQAEPPTSPRPPRPHIQQPDVIRPPTFTRQ